MKILNWMKSSRLGRSLERMLDSMDIDEPIFRFIAVGLFWTAIVMFHLLTLFAYAYVFVSLLF